MPTEPEVSTSRSELGTRLATVIGRYPTKKRASEVAGVTVEQLGRYVAGEAKPPFEVVVRLAIGAGFSLDWLATGMGAMPGNPELTRSWSAEPPHDFEGSRRPNSSIPPGAVEVPFYEDLRPAAGGGAVIERETARVLFFDETWLQRFFGVAGRDIIMLAAIGESMEDTIHAGDPLIVNISEGGRRLGEGIFIIRLEGALMVKRLQPLPGGRVKVSSANEAYESYELKLEDEALDFAIIGRVLCVCRRL